MTKGRDISPLAQYDNVGAQYDNEARNIIKTQEIVHKEIDYLAKKLDEALNRINELKRENELIKLDIATLLSQKEV
ncbi:hypothetical protein ACRE1U_04640 [Helicobacter himalayensis]|uniref:hypothetical protein n=1 Tax=Helicobacter himalayensis TaxID=1591088 RepID=UPI003D6DC169